MGRKTIWLDKFEREEKTGFGGRVEGKLRYIFPAVLLSFPWTAGRAYQRLQSTQERFFPYLFASFLLPVPFSAGRMLQRPHAGDFDSTGVALAVAYVHAAYGVALPFHHALLAGGTEGHLCIFNAANVADVDVSQAGLLRD